MIVSRFLQKHIILINCYLLIVYHVSNECAQKSGKVIYMTLAHCYSLYIYQIVIYFIIIVYLIYSTILG